MIIFFNENDYFKFKLNEINFKHKKFDNYYNFELCLNVLNDF